MDAAEIDDAVALLQRAAVLDACRDGPVGRAEIADRAGCSRSTAYRATVELDDEDLLARTDRGYRLTGAGAATVDTIHRFLWNLAGTERLQPLLEYVDDPELVRRAHLFDAAELVTPDPSSPYRVENRVKSIIDGTQERMYGMTIGLGSPALAEAMIDRIRAGVRVDWILPGDLYDQFTAGYGQLAEHALEEEQTSVCVREEIPIDLAVYDDTLVVIGFDQDRGVLGAVAIVEKPAALEWAEEAFDDCREDAEPVE